MLNRVMTGLVLMAVGGAAAWLIAAPAPDAPPDPAPASTDDALAFEARPLAEVVAAVAARAGHPVSIRTPGLGSRVVTLRLSADADGEALLCRFGEVLDRWDVALVRDPDPAAGWSAIAFTRTAPAVPGVAAEPFVVRVVEGRVRLDSGGRTLELVSGEEGGVEADGSLAAARRVEPSRVATWRTGAPAPSTLAESRFPAPGASLAWRVIGTTEDGRSVVEWGAPGESPRRSVLEKGAKEFRVPLSKP